MTILVTGASGAFARLVLDSLLARGVAPTDIVAGTRSPGALAEYAAQGIRPAELDFHRIDTIDAALEGVDRVLLVSGMDPERLAGHKNVVAAAARAGVSQLAYTSIVRADATDFPLAADHLATEEAIRDAGVPFTFLRNNWYIENYAADFARAASTGEIVAATGDGLVASAHRAEYAEAAAIVLSEDGHTGRAYELSGDQAWSYAELAAAAGAALGRDVVFRSISAEEQQANLEAAGLDAGTAWFYAALDTGIANGALSFSDGTLSRLLGRPTATLEDAVRAVIASS